MGNPRRDFVFPDADHRFLEARGLAWETVREGGGCWVVVHGYPVPAGYTIAEASVALQIPSSYPTTQIDMVYFWPHLSRANGRTIKQLQGHGFDGKEWQRWSRHRTPQNPWRADVDNLEMHLLLVDEWLEREVDGGAK